MNRNTQNGYSAYIETSDVKSLNGQFNEAAAKKQERKKKTIDRRKFSFIMHHSHIKCHLNVQAILWSQVDRSGNFGLEPQQATFKCVYFIFSFFSM